MCRRTYLEALWEGKAHRPEHVAKSSEHSHHKHLRWRRDRARVQFLAGAVMHTGPEVFEMDDRIFAIPICAFCG